MTKKKEIVIRYGYTNGENWIFQEFDITEIENGAAYEAISDNALLKNYKLKTRDRWSGLTDKNGVKVFEGDILFLLRKSTFHKHMNVEVIAKVYYRNGSYATETITCKNLSFLDKNSNWFGVKSNDFIHIVNIKDSEVIGKIHHKK